MESIWDEAVADAEFYLSFVEKLKPLLPDEAAREVVTRGIMAVPGLPQGTAPITAAFHAIMLQLKSPLVPIMERNNGLPPLSMEAIVLVGLFAYGYQMGRAE